MSDPFPDDKLTSHEYDGIREYDNPTPGWWHAIFAVTFVFSIGYFLIFHFSPARERLSPQARLAVAAERAAEASYGQFVPLVGERDRLLELSENAGALGIGKTIFASNCAVCHGQSGEGLVGPNLTDEFAKNIRMPEDIFAVVSGGIIEKGMPAWAVPLGKNDVVLVSAYVAGLRGRNLEGARGPEGEPMPEWPEVGGG